MYTSPNLLNVPWLMNVGNHDIGGSAYLCGHDPDDSLAAHDLYQTKCAGASETAAGMLLV